MNKKKIILIPLSFLLIFIFFLPALWVDPPVNYSNATISTIKTKIEELEKDIIKYKDSSYTHDPDRYWPYDLNRTVHGLFKYKKQNQRWPESWEALKASGLIKDQNCIHDNWIYTKNPNGWEIKLKDWGKIAFYKKPQK